MTTITLILAILLVAALAVLTVDWLERRQARRDREIVRRIQTYLSGLPPAKPW